MFRVLWVVVFDGWSLPRKSEKSVKIGKNQPINRPLLQWGEGLRARPYESITWKILSSATNSTRKLQARFGNCAAGCGCARCAYKTTGFQWIPQIQLLMSGEWTRVKSNCFARDQEADKHRHFYFCVVWRPDADAFVLASTGAVASLESNWHASREISHKKFSYVQLLH